MEPLAKECKILVCTFALSNYQEEIFKPDKRFASGLRPTGLYLHGVGGSVNFTLAHEDTFQIGDDVMVGIFGAFRVVEVNRVDKTMRVQQHSMFNKGFPNYFSMGESIVVKLLMRTYKEGSCASNL